MEGIDHENPASSEPSVKDVDARQHDALAAVGIGELAEDHRHRHLGRANRRRRPSYKVASPPSCATICGIAIDTIVISSEIIAMATMTAPITSARLEMRPPAVYRGESCRSPVPGAFQIENPSLTDRRERTHLQTPRFDAAS